jgi:hypothetical protein
VDRLTGAQVAAERPAVAVAAEEPVVVEVDKLYLEASHEN